MTTQNGQNGYPNGNHWKTLNGSVFIESKTPIPLNASEAEFIDFVKFHGIDELIKSLKMVHDFALYHTDLSLDTQEKNALFNLKILWEGFERMGKV
ncbi:hypothetical protein KFE94_13930 [bacterium SCSIO 12643]|nr:hypothetical protein KFE94_13930 [bacterium SCSIO 12643]